MSESKNNTEPSCLALILGLFGVFFLVCVPLSLLLTNPLIGVPVVILEVLIGTIVVFGIVDSRTSSSLESSPTAKYIDPSTLSGREFEHYVAKLLRERGYVAEVIGGAGDQGVDVLATLNNMRIAVQCKNYARAVGNRPVQEVYSGAVYHGCDEAWVVAPKGFTAGAKTLAKRLDVELIDENDLRNWSRRSTSFTRASRSPYRKSTTGSVTDEHSLLRTRVDQYRQLVEEYDDLVELLELVKESQITGQDLDFVEDVSSDELVTSILRLTKKLDDLVIQESGLAHGDLFKWRKEIDARAYRLIKDKI